MTKTVTVVENYMLLQSLEDNRLQFANFYSLQLIRLEIQHMNTQLEPRMEI